MHLLRIIVLALLVSPLAGFSQDETAALLPEQLDVLKGNWQGSLTYIDYSSGKPFSMPAEVSISQGKNKNELVLATSYPNEPKANSKTKIRLSKDGRLINKEKVVRINKNSDQSSQVVTEIMGKDGNDNKKAIIRHYYTISNSSFIIRKEVKFEGEENWILRNEYNYKRKTEF